MTYVSPILVGILYCLLMSLIREPHRRRFNAVMVGGAGAAYLSGGGFDQWELPMVALITYVAYRGLDSWTFIGIGWLLHTAWDLVHHLKGNPILPFAHDSSLSCAICDPVIALWCLGGGPSLVTLARGRFRARRTREPAAASTS
ncbi:DUF6010 family protein [Streptomyces rochei]|uniref:DUF6010 family protein n=1 Tax=Streptomyces TaxID=1883 RepID=UPI000F76C803|nr:MULTISPECIES: DUF6010 family protein [Streptomyces]MBJ6623257.1 hypothetical protein [Streptomyces sp. DHE17-7]MBQ0877717.1 hypothetical protein [Streptomyces sp. RT42]NUV94764.1 hypothetical protein [Streptomyces sp. KAI 90]RSS94401.1 hypothetical protein EF919_12620 [Streptomyces sp. WAC02707]WMI55573.1 DUF6010 family protein [Streptomyces rochei]